MILVKPSFEIMEVMGVGISGYRPLRLIEQAGRTCYKSESSIDSSSAENFIQMILKRGHESVIEHSAMTVKFIIDRGVSHELVRHRLCAFSQESTRYCNYKGGVTFVIPPWVELAEGEYFQESSNHTLILPQREWFCSLLEAEITYKLLLDAHWTPQQARSILPNSTKTEIVVTANFREWRHIFSLRCSKAAHPQMREVMLPLREKCREVIPIIFDEEKETGR